VASQAPAGLALRRFGPTRGIAAIMIVWGLCASAMGLINGGTAFVVARLALGAAEAGFFPAILLLATRWIADERRGRFIGLVAAAGVAATIVGPPIAANLLRLDGVAGLAGWRWLFLVEGAPALALGLAAPFVLADGPTDAKWLTQAERALLLREAAPSPPGEAPSSWRVVVRPELVLLAVMSFTIESCAYTIAYWMPLVIKGMGLSIIQVGYAASLPGAVGCVAMILWASSSDRTGERRAHLAAAMALGGLGLIACGLLLHSPVLAMAALCLSAAGVVSTTPVLWSIPPRILPPSALPLGVALIGAVGNAGGFVAPPLVGVLEDWTHDFRLGLVVAGAPVLLAAALAFAVRPDPGPAASRAALAIDPLAPSSPPA
jgi:ACS family tartrate transporter-like MFS transporter